MTGQKSLYLGRSPKAWVVGLSDAVSDELLDSLWAAEASAGDYYWVGA